MRTPDQHVRELEMLAKYYESKLSLALAGVSGPVMETRYRRRAEAIRWILAETAYGCDVQELAV
jgi:hypothetical protein